MGSCAIAIKYLFDPNSALVSFQNPPDLNVLSGKHQETKLITFLLKCVLYRIPRLLYQCSGVEGGGYARLRPHALVNKISSTIHNFYRFQCVVLYYA